MFHIPLHPGLRATASTALLLAIGAVTVSAQGLVPPTGTAATGEVTSWSDPAIATLLLVDALDEPNAAAVVIRRPGDHPSNIILVTRKTSPAELARAVTALIGSRRARGDHVDATMRAPIAPVTARSSGKPSRDEQLARAELQRVKLAPPFDIPGIGRGPAVVVRMSAKAMTKKPAPR